MKIKKLLILILTLILLVTLCVNIFAADKKVKSFDDFSKNKVVVIQRYSGSW
jgi:hypothetical protein